MSPLSTAHLLNAYIFSLVKISSRLPQACCRRTSLRTSLIFVNAVDVLNVRAVFHTKQLHIRQASLADEHSRVTQRANDFSIFIDLHAGTPRATRFRCGSVPPANSLLVRPTFRQTHEKRVRVAYVIHTQHFGDASCGALYTSRRLPALSSRCIARTTPLPLSPPPGMYTTLRL